MVVATQALEELLREEGLRPVRQLLDRHVNTYTRWIRQGVRGVRLEATKDGWEWMTSQAAVDRFRARLRGLSIPTPVATPAQMRRRAAQADAERRARRKGGQMP